MNPRQMVSLVRRAMGQWTKDNAAFLAAGLAFNVMLALSPLLIVLLAIAGLFLTPERVESRLLASAAAAVSPGAAELLREVIAGARSSGAGPVASAIGIVITLVASSNVIQQMKYALNAVWHVPPGVMTMRSFVFGRFRSLLVLGMLAIVMLAWLALDASLAVLGRVLPGALDAPPLLWSAVTSSASIVINSAVFGFFYRFIPDTPVRWRDVAFGSVFAAVLFTIGKALLGFYFDVSATLRAFGAAGSLVAILVWLYYSGQIFLLGAEVTAKYATTHGSRATAPLVRGAAP
jgi:membrane protein